MNESYLRAVSGLFSAPSGLRSVPESANITKHSSYAPDSELAPAQ